MPQQPHTPTLTMHREDLERGAIRYEIWANDEYLTGADDDIVPDAKVQFERIVAVTNAHEALAAALGDLNISDAELLRFRNSLEGKEWTDCWAPFVQSIVDCVRQCRAALAAADPTR